MFSCVRHSADGQESQSPLPTQARSKRSSKQRVQLQLMELEGVTLSNGILFAKVRLLGGGRFCQYSARKEIRDNKVVWSDHGPMEFACRFGGTGPCFLRVSVRKEERGGRSYSKLGFAVLDLSHLSPGGAAEQHSCILNPYNQRQRLDNSTLKLSLRRLVVTPTHPQVGTGCQGASPASTAAAVAAAAAAAASTAAVADSTPTAVAAAAVEATPGTTAAEITLGSSSAATAFSIATSAAAAAAAGHSRTNSQASAATVATEQLLQHGATTPLQMDCLLPPTVSSQSANALTFDHWPSSLERKRAAFTPARDQQLMSSRIANTRTDNFKIAREILEQEGIRISIPESTAG